jgi:hypothetical protein
MYTENHIYVHVYVKCILLLTTTLDAQQDIVVRGYKTHADPLPVIW